MGELNRTFLFNTFITGNDADGKFNEQTHSDLVDPVFARIKQNDGITKCYVAQATIQVHFLDYITDEATVIEIVNEAVSWAASQDLFPHRGNKTPTATMVSHTSSKPSNYMWVYVRFNSNLIKFPVDPAEAQYDTAAFRTQVSSLASELTDIDGINDYVLTLRGAGLNFDTRVTDAQTVESHMNTLLNSERIGDAYFPYLSDDKPLQLKFWVKQA